MPKYRSPVSPLSFKKKVPCVTRHYREIKEAIAQLYTQANRHKGQVNTPRPPQLALANYKGDKSTTKADGSVAELRTIATFP